MGAQVLESFSAKALSNVLSVPSCEPRKQPMREPGRFETWAAARAKHLLVERASRSGIPPSPTDRESSLVEGDKVFGVDCAACHGMDGHRPTDAGHWMYLARGGFNLEGRAELFRPGIVLDHQEWDSIERHARFCKS